jgi:hypothetical protein
VQFNSAHKPGLKKPYGHRLQGSLGACLPWPGGQDSLKQLRSPGRQARVLEPRSSSPPKPGSNRQAGTQLWLFQQAGRHSAVAITWSTHAWMLRAQSSHLGGLAQGGTTPPAASLSGPPLLQGAFSAGQLSGSSGSCVCWLHAHQPLHGCCCFRSSSLLPAATESVAARRRLFAA